MKNVEDMTLKEAVNEFSSMLLDFLPDHIDENRFTDLFNKIQDEADIDLAEQHCFTALVEIWNDNESYQIVTNAISGDFYGFWRCDNLFPDMERTIYSVNLFQIQRDCATFSLAKIQEELTDEVLETVFKGHDIVSFDYFLANPRKDVVEWALKHKDELGLNKVKPEFIEEHQAIPELKELILKAL